MNFEVIAGKILKIYLPGTVGKRSTLVPEVMSLNPTIPRHKLSVFFTKDE
jgi:hypothetical protein